MSTALLTALRQCAHCGHVIEKSREKSSARTVRTLQCARTGFRQEKQSHSLARTRAPSLKGGSARRCHEGSAHLPETGMKPMPSPEDCATLQALFEGVDGMRRTVEREWGAERLPLLVDDELRARFRRQQAKWSAAYQTAWEMDVLTRDALEAVEVQAGGLRRAWSALAAAASEAGHRPLTPWVWEIMLGDGSVAALVQTGDEADKAVANGRYVAVYTMAEIGNVLSTLLPESLQAAKVVFPGARFVGSGDMGWVKGGDEVPFGDAA